LESRRRLGMERSREGDGKNGKEEVN
jgi:hypothetical protein